MTEQSDPRPVADPFNEITVILARGVRRHFEKNNSHLGSSGSGWLPTAPDVDIANAVNAFQSDG
jgi:hypothetical protein